LVDPRTARDFVYVDDVSDAFVRAADAKVEPGAVFNIGSGSQTTLAELVDAARRVLGVDAEPDWGSYAARAWDTDSWVSDPRRAERELGWSAGTAIDEGLRLTANWMRESPAAAGRYEPEAAV
jgi:nucleoside-diphosphate-sugar epimerase